MKWAGLLRWRPERRLGTWVWASGVLGGGGGVWRTRVRRRWWVGSVGEWWWWLWIAGTPENENRGLRPFSAETSLDFGLSCGE